LSLDHYPIPNLFYHTTMCIYTSVSIWSWNDR